ncbi:hypothetical protein GCM10009839_32670 [Catenulispora yoronensis]|uniref:NAD(+)--protein-arginine ADP-ribosyltransferase n=1 Tax=Catenulispora yoronensis TaxID=450799 RepID=A0ABN2U797_9ACTN
MALTATVSPAQASASAPSPTTPQPAPPPSLTPTLEASTSAPLTPASPCTDTDREAFRTLLGSRYNIHLRPVVSAIARVPALRAVDVAAARVELAAVRTYLHDASPESGGAVLDRALRSGEPSHRAPALHAYGACLTAGLRRLPAYLGPVYQDSRIDPAWLAEYRVGRTLVEPAPVGASVFLDRVGAGGFLIWSVTGRRTALLEDRVAEQRGAVRFLPGSRFRVLGVRAAPTGSPLVLLCEDIAQTGALVDAAVSQEENVLARLLAVADAAVENPESPDRAESRDHTKTGDLMPWPPLGFRAAATS